MLTLLMIAAEGEDSLLQYSISLMLDVRANILDILSKFRTSYFQYPLSGFRHHMWPVTGFPCSEFPFSRLLQAGTATDADYVGWRRCLHRS